MTEISTSKKKKDSLFDFGALRRNFLKIRWLPMRSGKDGKDGFLLTFAKAVLFIVVFALLFMAIDAVLSLISYHINLCQSSQGKLVDQFKLTTPFSKVILNPYEAEEAEVTPSKETLRICKTITPE